MVVGIEREHLLCLRWAFLFDDRLEQRFLAVEIDIKGPLRDAGLSRDLTHACSIEALRQEHGSRAVQDLPPFGAVLLIATFHKLNVTHVVPPASTDPHWSITNC